MQAVLCLVSHSQTEHCAESRYNLNVPSLSCGRAVRAPGRQQQSDDENLQWELGLEQGPRQDRHQRGKKEGEAELRGFAGGCARKPLEQPYGCRQCRAPPASITPVTIPASFSSAAGQRRAGAALGSPPAFPTLCSCSSGATGLTRVWGQGREGSGVVGKQSWEWGAGAAQQSSAPSPAAPEHEPTCGHRRGH